MYGQKLTTALRDYIKEYGAEYVIEDTCIGFVLMDIELKYTGTIKVMKPFLKKVFKQEMYTTDRWRDPLERERVVSEFRRRIVKAVGEFM